MLFFIGNGNEATESLKAEQKMFKDVVLMEVKEAMNEGKTYHMLRWLTKNITASYVMKADDDSYIVIPNLLNRLNYYAARFNGNYNCTIVNDITPSLISR